MAVVRNVIEKDQGLKIESHSVLAIFVGIDEVVSRG